MVRKIIRYAIDARHSFMKYFIVGIVGVGLDLVTLTLFRERLGVTPYIAVMLNQIIIISFNFTANKIWSFNNKTLPHKQFVRYMMLFAFNYALAIFFMYIFNEHIGIDYRQVRIGTIVLSLSWNFVLYRHWVFHIDAVSPTDTKKRVLQLYDRGCPPCYNRQN
ncbi:MAG: hypothetical protein CO029_00275 [Candidatus Magasanikbacteria bacterium CG_4_9_14_0_2_um_filter_41_10]|uniref:GtrA/DPMS transmembrane domain-containing protein n=1 Tax=Candidatus Magasanikbacteria bacterium CG_4_10_14_0_2_um_filter_41_31 TaxID=1974639 RepID=A0A2M7V1W4_9BACT|nr:MAG: hypothetical protein AUJ37_02985 [Candidatus Magasanikbacteria bacterium CG1_02_41_34]PIZ92319.1 MAG: hypothetical protein COX83_04465 [Candidatus Magasanikbacteria bacterium CG_4_10_14_0_2_um_filter_41_31]PJC53904.1 MAG: hypothetical protein CO029_00275 [Candidatus Magasanikbacteria bacterium CG_4_9_14_0_2_um_filter_41_10]